MKQTRWLKQTCWLLTGLLAACQAPSAKEQPLTPVPITHASPAASPTSPPPAEPGPSLELARDTSLGEATDTANQDMARYYLVIADTGSSYYALRDRMRGLAARARVPIDTMNRTFNKAKNRITLPDDDEDEMYAGEYYPRRTPSRTLSLEYLDVYQKTTTPQTIALVAGIYEQAASADSALAALQRVAPKAFRLSANVYVGCMH